MMYKKCAFSKWTIKSQIKNMAACNVLLVKLALKLHLQNKIIKKYVKIGYHQNVCPNTLLECLNSRIYGFLTQFFPCFFQHACQVLSVPYLHFVDPLFQYWPDSKIHGIQVWNVQGPINVLQQSGIIRKILLKEVEQF